MTRWTMAAVLVAWAAAPAVGQGRLGVEAYGGVLFDEYDARTPTTGAIAGLRLGYGITGRTRLVASTGYGETNDVLNPNGLRDYYRKGNNWIFTTAGLEHDVIRGRTGASVALEGGAAWRSLDDEGVVGRPTYPDEWAGGGTSAYGTLAVGATLRQRVASRWEVSLTVRDYWMELERHSPAVSLGVGRR